MSEHRDRKHLLVGIYEELLGVEPVGIDDDFFALGGHSALAVRLINILRERFDADISMRAVFESPTPAALASRLGASRRPRPQLTRRCPDH